LKCVAYEAGDKQDSPSGSPQLSMEEYLAFFIMILDASIPFLSHLVCRQFSYIPYSNRRWAHGHRVRKQRGKEDERTNPWWDFCDEFFGISGGLFGASGWFCGILVDFLIPYRKMRPWCMCKDNLLYDWGSKLKVICVDFLRANKECVKYFNWNEISVRVII